MTEEQYMREQIKGYEAGVVRNRLSCPECGGQSATVKAADFRFSSSGMPEQRRCLSCGHLFDYADGCTA